ncbi:MAG: patatin-like phospholipase family protein [Alphaproteobacteria bacterium]|nr:patatin-like phospholipase family protein [Alphaproteobacteria bacterium]
MKTVFVASLTGGSANTVTQAVCAEKLLEETGLHLAQIFDGGMACASGGAINGGALSLGPDGKPLVDEHRLVEIWPTCAERILKRDLGAALRFVGGDKPVLSSEGRIAVMRECLGDIPLSRIQNDLVIIGHNVETAYGEIFSSRYARGEFGPRTPDFILRDPREHDFLLSDAVVGSSALPGIFESHTMTNVAGRTLIIADGGISKNNPINLATNMALNKYGADTRIVAFEFGSGIERIDPDFEKKGWRDWQRRIRNNYVHHTSGLERPALLFNPQVIDFFNFDFVLNDIADKLSEAGATDVPVPSADRLDGRPEQVEALIAYTRYALEHGELKETFRRACESIGERHHTRKRSLFRRLSHPADRFRKPPGPAGDTPPPSPVPLQ